MPGPRSKLEERSQRAEQGESSRSSLAGAGWKCEPGQLGKGRRFSWLNPAPLWRSRNDRVSRLLGDPTNEQRRAWMKQLGIPEGPAPVSDYADRTELSFLVMGDTGEGDESQMALVRPLLSVGEGTAFLFICSDVIYPAGEVDEYGPKFFEPYRELPGPIYAIPGNHDWYDGLVGFMFHFCGAEDAPARPKLRSLTALARSILSSRARKPDAAKVAAMRALRAAPGQQGRQPAPYFAIDAGPVRLVGIDTGISGVVDREQAAWLRRVSKESDRPKILLTGKPIYVDGTYREGKLEGQGSVDEIVRAPEHNYIAAIGGDIHNYQRYPVRVPGDRVIQYIVSGGGGAFMHATHSIPKIDPEKAGGATEDEFRCYPLRGDSLSIYSKLYGRKLGPAKKLMTIPADEAAAIVAKRLGITPARPDARTVVPSKRAERAAAVLYRLPGRAGGALHFPFSEFLDWNDPPLFKSFLRVDAKDGEVRIRCFAATGCREHENDPPLEDSIRAERSSNGEWRWKDETPG
jgi:Calcineurin-like phosphoesterase